MRNQSKRIRKESKRILSVTVSRQVDDCPDTSWLGEYSNTRKSDFSIDRAHAEDCASVSLVAEQAKQTLEHAMQTVADIQRPLGITTADYEANETEWEALEDAYTQLGELANEVTDCDCGEHGDMGRHEYRYFNSSFNYVDKQGKPSDGLTPEEVRKYTRQDYERMERLHRGDWCFIGITAEAEVGIPSGHTSKGTCYTVQQIHSGGLWGIESDSEASYIESEEKNQLADLKDQLRALGFSTRAISKAFEDVKHKDY